MKLINLHGAISSGMPAYNPPIGVSFLQRTVETGVNNNSITFPAVNAGSEFPTRVLIGLLFWESNGGDLVSGTIDGNAITVHAQNNAAPAGVDDIYCAIFSVALPTGTSVVPIFNFDANVNDDISLALYRGVNLSSSTPYDTDVHGDDADPVNMSIDVPEGGFVIAGAISGVSGSGPITTTGVTENFDTTQQSNRRVVGGFASGLSAQTGRAIVFDASGGTAELAAVAASFG